MPLRQMLIVVGWRDGHRVDCPVFVSHYQQGSGESDRQCHPRGYSRNDENHDRGHDHGRDSYERHVP